MQRNSAVVIGRVPRRLTAIRDTDARFFGFATTGECCAICIGCAFARGRPAGPALDDPVRRDRSQRRARGGWCCAKHRLAHGRQRLSRSIRADAHLPASDTVDVPLPDGGVYPEKINATYNEQGIDALVGAMSALYDVPIDAHIVLDMDDFTRLVDAVGTIEVNPDAPLTDPIVDLDLEAGPQEIDGLTANGYVRTRVDQDYGRMGRQQEVLVALVAKLVNPETEVDLAALLEGLASLETDLPLDQLGTLMELARRTADAEVRYVLIEPPLITFEGDRDDGRGYVLEADFPAIQAEGEELLGE